MHPLILDRRIRIAACPDTLPQTLDRLARDSDECVRMCVADNPRAWVRTLKYLAKDSSEVIRQRIILRTSVRTKKALDMG